MSIKQKTYFQKYQEELSSAEGRQKWDEDAYLGNALSGAAAVTSILAIMAETTGLVKNRYVSASLKVAGAIGFLASCDWSKISDNKKKIAALAKQYGYIPKNEETFARDLFENTWSRPLLKDRYVQQLKSEVK